MLTWNNDWKTNLNNTKWLLTLLIVLYHINVNLMHEPSQLYLYIKNLGDCVVPAFALISGYLFFYNCNHFEDIKSKMNKRIYSLLIPYFSWNIINAIFIAITTHHLNIWKNIFYWKSTPHFWYIFMLMFWTILSPILFTFIRNRKYLLILFLLEFLYIIYNGSNILHSRFIYMIFTWGGVLGFYFPDLIKKITARTLSNRLIILALLIPLYLYIGTLYIGITDMKILVWCYFIRALLLICILMNLPQMLIGKITNYKYSFWFFAMHFWLDHHITKIFVTCIPDFLLQFSVFLTVVLIMLITGYLINKYFPKIFNILCGQRIR